MLVLGIKGFCQRLRLTAVPVTQCVPFAWPAHEGTGGAAVVVGGGFVEDVAGGFVCAGTQHRSACAQAQSASHAAAWLHGSGTGAVGLAKAV